MTTPLTRANAAEELYSAAGSIADALKPATRTLSRLSYASAELDKFDPAPREPDKTDLRLLRNRAEEVASSIGQLQTDIRALANRVAKED